MIMIIINKSRKKFLISCGCFFWLMRSFLGKGEVAKPLINIGDETLE